MPQPKNQKSRDQTFRRARNVVAVTFGSALVLLVLAGPIHARETRSFTFDSDFLSVANLVGEVEVVAASGSEFVVEAAVRGADAEDGLVDFDVRRGGRSSLLVAFPVDRHRRYVYPEYNGRTTLSRDYSEKKSLLSALLSALTDRNVRVSGRGPGLELWVDLRVEVPAGAALDLDNGVGDIAASGVSGDLMVRSRSGRLNGNDLSGDSVFDLGSGAVHLTSVTGELVVDTGSGGVSVDRFEGPALSVDTGSGTVSLSGIRTRRLIVDTGSGGVRAEAVAAEEAFIDTGSGSVRLALTEMGPGDFHIDTGSGSITLLLPAYASALVDAETGSGGIDVALDGVRLLRRERDEMQFEVGSGEARVRLDTGSGGIRIASVDR